MRFEPKIWKELMIFFASLWSITIFTIKQTKKKQKRNKKTFAFSIRKMGTMAAAMAMTMAMASPATTKWWWWWPSEPTDGKFCFDSLFQYISIYFKSFAFSWILSFSNNIDDDIDNEIRNNGPCNRWSRRIAQTKATTAMMMHWVSTA